MTCKVWGDWVMFPWIKLKKPTRNWALFLPSESTCPPAAALHYSPSLCFSVHPTYTAGQSSIYITDTESRCKETVKEEEDIQRREGKRLTTKWLSVSFNCTIFHGVLRVLPLLNSRCFCILLVKLFIKLSQLKWLQQWMLAHCNQS